MKTGTRCWLMKSEPDVFSIDDLERKGVTAWDGVRNYQARNFMRDEMKVGDRVLFYHSSTQPPGVVGLARIAGAARPDETAQDESSDYYDPKATKENPIWMLVDVAFVEKFAGVVSLDALRAEPDLADMLVLRRGMRLSIQPVELDQYDLVVRLGRRK